MEEKTCTVCKIEKHINNFYKKYSECKDCIIQRGLKRYYDNIDNISIQQKNNLKKIERNYYKKNMITEQKKLRF